MYNLLAAAPKNYETAMELMTKLFPATEQSKRMFDDYIEAYDIIRDWTYYLKRKTETYDGYQRLVETFEEYESMLKEFFIENQMAIIGYGKPIIRNFPTSPEARKLKHFATFMVSLKGSSKEWGEMAE